MKMKIRKGDRVRVMRGAEEDKDKVGEVIRVLPKENRVVVQGINMVKKHQKQSQSGGKTIPAGIREFEAPIHASNVAVVDREAEKESKEARKASKAKADSAKKPAAKKTAVKKAETKPEAKKPVKKAAVTKAKTAESKKKAAEGN